MGRAMSQDMEAELFRTVEEGKKAARVLLSHLDKTEILLQQYTKEAYKMRGKENDTR